MKYYIYRHIRLDKNEPFYIGFGTKLKEFYTFQSEFSRAYNKTSRSKYWKHITNKTNYKIEILIEFVEEKI